MCTAFRVVHADGNVTGFVGDVKFNYVKADNGWASRRADFMPLFVIALAELFVSTSVGLAEVAVACVLSNLHTGAVNVEVSSRI